MTAAPYDYQRLRWACCRPIGVRWSAMLLGRRETQRRVIDNGEVRVCAFKTTAGVMFYHATTETGKPPAGSRVQYRVRFKLKPHVWEKIHAEHD